VTETAWQARIAENLRWVRERIAAALDRAGRQADEVVLVAVTKTFPATVVRAAAAAGLCDIGENRVQEAAAKRSELQGLAGVRWHLIGHLQRNKAGSAVELFDMIQSVDSLELAAALSRRAVGAGRAVSVLLEVNVGLEASKSGFPPHEEVLLRAVEGILPLERLKLEGLMTVAPMAHNPEEVRPVFRRLAALRAILQERYPEAPWGHLSMGMTDDYEVAVEEGATMVRVGRALFGQRTREQ